MDLDVPWDADPCTWIPRRNLILLALDSLINNARQVMVYVHACKLGQHSLTQEDARAMITYRLSTFLLGFILVGLLMVSLAHAQVNEDIIHWPQHAGRIAV